MRDYFLRRFILIPPTLLGVTLIVFFITRLVPGGPIERALAEARQADATSGIRADRTAGTSLSEAQMQQLREFYGFDKPWYLAYFEWVGNVFQGNLGTSYIYHQPVTTVITSKLPISIYFGLLTTIITYAVCLPLGIVKAVRHRGIIDNATSIVVFAGYAVPNYVFGSMILFFFAARLEWFPLGGFVSDDFASLGAGGKFLDLVRHTTLPLAAYLVSSFAFTTLLMKNHLMDNLAADYMRTAVAKGVPFKSAVFKHALRNSLIPLATTFGQNLGLVLAGSFLIEVVFDIDGMGLLGFKSIVDRDYPVVMGILLISSVLLLVGNILSDMLVALLDPRIRFQ